MKSDDSNSSVMRQQEIGFNDIQSSPVTTELAGIANLLNRCREDLVSLDQVLGKIEAACRIEVGQISDQKVKIDCAEVRDSQSTKNQQVELAGETIRRVAEDIENLCRIPQSASIEAMLNQLQSKMVRCLKLIPFACR